MTSAQLTYLEERLQLPLPDYYKRTMLDYPFAADSFAAECSLSVQVDHILGMNTIFPPEARRFVVGGDCGEELYYVKVDESSERVYRYEYETSGDSPIVQADSWAPFLEQLRDQEVAIEQDELAEAEMKRNKKWWQFWI